jgi:hypothetical protein
MRRSPLVLAALRNGAIAGLVTDQALSTLVPFFVGCQACRRRRIAPLVPALRQTPLRHSRRTFPTMMRNDDDDGDGSESGASTTESLFEIGSVEDIPEEAWQELEQGQPSEWMVMKDVRP